MKNLRALILKYPKDKQIIFKNTFWLALAELISRGLKLFLIIFSAKILGATEYGKFSFALAFVGFFLFVSDFGLNQIIIREFAKKPRNLDISTYRNIEISRYRDIEISSLFSLKLLLSILAFFLIFLSSLWITKDIIVRKVILVLGLMIITHSFGETFFSFLRAKQKMEKEAITRIGESLLVTILGLFILFKIPSIFYLSLAYFSSAFLATLAMAVFFHLKVYPLNFKFKISTWKKFLSLSWPLAFVSIFAIIYNQIDSVMMGLWNQITETGWYNAAYKIAQAALLPSVLLANTFLPSLTFSLQKGKEKFFEILTLYFKISLILAVPLVAGGIILAPQIIQFVYGPQFTPSVFAFQILIIGGALIYITTLLSRVILVFNLQKKIFFVTFLAAVINIILNLVFIPKYSLYGASLSTLLTFIFILFAFLKIISFKISPGQIFKKLKKDLLSVVLATLIMLLAIAFLLNYSINVVYIVLAGALVYFMVIFITSIMPGWRNW